MDGESTDASCGQGRFGRRTDGRDQHDVNVADEIDCALKLLVIVTVMLARGSRDASLDETECVSRQIENLKVRRSAKVLMNELSIHAADGHA